MSSATLSVTTPPAMDDEVATEAPLLGCACGGHLELHQPDPDRTGRLLGVCLECGAWHLVTILVIGEPGAAA